jgi:hypothetical protein
LTGLGYDVGGIWIGDGHPFKDEWFSVNRLFHIPDPKDSVNASFNNKVFVTFLGKNANEITRCRYMGTNRLISNQVGSFTCVYATHNGNVLTYYFSSKNLINECDVHDLVKQITSLVKDVYAVVSGEFHHTVGTSRRCKLVFRNGVFELRGSTVMPLCESSRLTCKEHHDWISVNYQRFNHEVSANVNFHGLANEKDAEANTQTINYEVWVLAYYKKCLELRGYKNLEARQDRDADNNPVISLSVTKDGETFVGKSNSLPMAYTDLVTKVNDHALKNAKGGKYNRMVAENPPAVAKKLGYALEIDIPVEHKNALLAIGYHDYKVFEGLDVTGRRAYHCSVVNNDSQVSYTGHGDTEAKAYLNLLLKLSNINCVDQIINELLKLGFKDYTTHCVVSVREKPFMVCYITKDGVTYTGTGDNSVLACNNMLQNIEHFLPKKVVVETPEQTKLADKSVDKSTVNDKLHSNDDARKNECHDADHDGLFSRHSWYYDMMLSPNKDNTSKAKAVDPQPKETTQEDVQQICDMAKSIFDNSAKKYARREWEQLSKDEIEIFFKAARQVLGVLKKK